MAGGRLGIVSAPVLVVVVVRVTPVAALVAVTVASVTAALDESRAVPVRVGVWGGKADGATRIAAKKMKKVPIAPNRRRPKFMPFPSRCWAYSCGTDCLNMRRMKWQMQMDSQSMSKTWHCISH